MVTETKNVAHSIKFVLIVPTINKKMNSIILFSFILTFSFCASQSFNQYDAYLIEGSKWPKFISRSESKDSLTPCALKCQNEGPGTNLFVYDSGTCHLGSLNANLMFLPSQSDSKLVYIETGFKKYSNSVQILNIVFYEFTIRMVNEQV